jgi:hypothetical protein
MKVSFREPDGTLKQEIKIAMAIDNYKLPKKEEWWAKCVEKMPQDFFKYRFDREEITQGLSLNTSFVIRYFRLKEVL